jgi:hypothetical protein
VFQNAQFTNEATYIIQSTGYERLYIVIHTSSDAIVGQGSSTFVNQGALQVASSGTASIF